MEVDQNVVIPEMSEDDKQIDEILHSQKGVQGEIKTKFFKRF
jgi:hypothetical protein